MSDTKDQKREDLIKAIRVFTVDRPNDEPNNPAEVQDKCLEDLLTLPWPTEPAASMKRHGDVCMILGRASEARADMLRDLRRAADAHFGENFKRERRRTPVDPSDPGDERNYTIAEVDGWPVGEDDDR